MVGGLDGRASVFAGLAVAFLASCAAPAIVECGDGRVCPGGSVCTSLGCSLPGVCGDGAIDDGEDCDDGNRIGSDGCSPKCAIEGCTNGALDLGEECDDGNAMSHDGCSSGCRIERPAWRQLIPTSTPGPLAAMAAVWVPDRGRALVHGGFDGLINRSEAWWWDGEGWTPAPSGPSARTQHAMAWDGAGTVVMFGGGPADRCWLFTTAWTPCVGTLPPARIDPGLATGAVPGEVLLVGGSDGTAMPDNRTWRWSSTGWSDAVRSGPVTPHYPALAFDPIENHHVLVHQHEPAPLRTWTLGPAGWTWVTDGWVPRENAALVHDPSRRVMLVFGGLDFLVADHNELLEYGATGWTEIAVGLRPPLRSSHATFHDPIRHALVIMGGFGASGPLADTWALRWESATADEDCDVTVDADGDGLTGCADPDCWARCDPRCPPGDMDCDPARPRCGDGTCNYDLETTGLCSSDCP